MSFFDFSIINYTNKNISKSCFLLKIYYTIGEGKLNAVSIFGLKEVPMNTLDKLCISTQLYNRKITVLSNKKNSVFVNVTIFIHQRLNECVGMYNIYV